MMLVILGVQPMMLMDHGMPMILMEDMLEVMVPFFAAIVTQKDTRQLSALNHVR
jgi:hypothetical protein